MPKITIELAPPYRVNDEPASYQSLWFLLRTFYAHEAEGAELSALAVQARFPGSANFRMLVSRAFRDFESWNIQVGWGSDRGTPVPLLSPARRSQGPFWMEVSSAKRISLRLDGRPANKRTLARFLGIDENPKPARSAVDYVMQDVGYWCELTQAMRLAEDGFTGSAGHTAGAGFRAARRSARDAFQTALALLKESLSLRKHGQLDRGSEALARLEAHLEANRSARFTPTLSAMAAVARSWDRYSRGRIAVARTELERLAADPELRLVIRYNPRVRFEYLNLLALVHKAIALNDCKTGPARRADSAERALSALSGALQAAYEADSIDAAQDVAANIGLTLWLCWKSELIDGARERTELAVQCQAVRWLALSEWICDRFGVGGDSAWNTIFLLRIARGACAPEGGDIGSFRKQEPLTIEQVVAATAPFHAAFSPAKGYVRWSTLAAYAIEEHDSGRNHYGALQLANLLLEAAWFHAHESGLCPKAYAAVERLFGLLAGLQPAQRVFFHESLEALPSALRQRGRKKLPEAAA